MSAQNNAAAPPQSSPTSPQPGPRRSFRWARLVPGLLAGLLLLLVLATAVVIFLLRSDTGQAWLTEKLNTALESSLAESGLRIKITHLSGALPFTVDFGITAADAHGIWLNAPENSFVWDWRALPQSVRIALLQSRNAVVSRLPDLPPGPEEPPRPPLSEQELRLALADAARTWADLPGLLPALRLEKFSLENLALPPDILGGAAPARPDGALLGNLEAGFAAGAEGARLQLEARLTGAQGRPLALPGLSSEGLQATVTIRARPEKSLEGTSGEQTRLNLEAHAEARAARPVLRDAALPETLFGTEARLTLALTAGLEAGATGPATDARLGLDSLDLAAGRLAMSGQGVWQGGAGSWLDGKVDSALHVRLSPAPHSSVIASAPASEGTTEAAAMSASDPAKAGPREPLSALRAPLSLDLAARGPLGAPDVRLTLACAALAFGGHDLEDLNLVLAAAPLAWKKALEQGETGADLALRARLDQQPASLETRLFAGRGLHGADDALSAGLRRLHLSAAGLTAEGQVTALLVPEKMPGLDGSLRLRVTDWRALSAFTPGNRLDGEAALELTLRSASRQGQNGQEVLLGFSVPRFSLTSGQGEALRLRGLTGEARLTDAFGRASLAARLALAGLKQGQWALGAEAVAQGPLQGPLEAQLKTTGGVLSHVQAQWRPGRCDVRTLDLRVPGRKLGLRATRALEVRYGDAGLAVSGLDLTLAPSGAVRAQGVLSPGKLDFSVNVDHLALEPWRALVPGLPAGSVEARLRLSGKPAAPGGDFRVRVHKLRVPGSPLAPLDLALAGGIERSAAGNALAARLELNPESVKALGGSQARLRVRLPLVFGADGLPRPAPQGPLRGQVRWTGAVGPLWTLLPLADRRLDGQVALALDLGGTLADPRVSGSLRVDKARYEDLLLGVLLTDINLRLDLAERGKKPGPQSPVGGILAGSGLRLELTAADGLGGSLRLAGTGDADGRNLTIQGSLNHLRPLRRRDLRIDLSGRAQVTGSAFAPQVRGEIVINQGALLLNKLARGGGITTLPVQGAGEAPAPPARARRQAAPAAASPAEGGGGLLDMRIRAPGRFMVQGHGLTSEWQADLLVRGTLAAPLITGELRAIRGNFNFLTRDFKLTRGVITFGGGSLSNPLLDIVLTCETPDITAHVNISGTVSTMKLSLSSDPSLPREEIISRILFGRSTDELGQLEALRLAGAVAQLAGFGSGGAGIFDFTRKTLGVDVLRINSASGGPGDDPDAAGPSLEMGKYIGDQIYVGVEQGMKQDSTAFLIDLELTPRTRLELRTEQENTWGGIRWKYNY
ncbi:translocation/assembly module TamB domain-containing protein [Desulfovibrio sp. ZJ200]|uniref:translocation/assembly module TamB domain-containing protein n=1 Tax=Desulfovibrio sp. ZJ200 TaxID=2709792 RepID=UPI0013EE18D6|nr:translocation/assembly module TamB domain-containing protein [Desulfovibrio sp. ZJ200]